MLVVCTANLCRSPVSEALLARRLAGVVDVDGARWTVASAGTDRFDGLIEPDTVAAAAALGLDISSHTPRQVTQADLDDADLVVTMTRSHVRSIVASVESAWPRTFTLKELVRRAVQTPAPSDGFDGWLKAVAAGRRTADLMSSSPDDDVADPYRQGRSANVAMVNELDRLTEDLVIWGPWQPLDSTASPSS